MMKKINKVREIKQDFGENAAFISLGFCGEWVASIDEQKLESIASITSSIERLARLPRRTLMEKLMCLQGQTAETIAKNLHAVK